MEPLRNKLEDAKFVTCAKLYSKSLSSALAEAIFQISVIIESVHLKKCEANFGDISMSFYDNSLLGSIEALSKHVCLVIDLDIFVSAKLW